MGAIIKMDSKELIKKFLPEIKDHTKFQFVVLSKTITTNDTQKNAVSMSKLVPPAAILRSYVEGDDTNQFIEEYGRYLAHPSNEAMLTVIAKAAVVDDMNMVLLCSSHEAESGYVDMMCKYMTALYDVKTTTPKKFLKDPSKYNNHDDREKKTKAINERLKRISEEDLRSLDSKEDQIKSLKRLKSKEIRQMAKDEGLKLKKDMDKKDMIKKLLKFRKEAN